VNQRRFKIVLATWRMRAKIRYALVDHRIRLWVALAPVLYQRVVARERELLKRWRRELGLWVTYGPILKVYHYTNVTEAERHNIEWWHRFYGRRARLVVRQRNAVGCQDISGILEQSQEYEIWCNRKIDKWFAAPRIIECEPELEFRSASLIDVYRGGPYDRP
jgi:hypothetical protein